MGLDKDGMCIYIKARDELAEEARKLLADTAAKELKGEEGREAAEGLPGRGRGGRGRDGGDVRIVGLPLNLFWYKSFFELHISRLWKQASDDILNIPYAT